MNQEIVNANIRSLEIHKAAMARARQDAANSAARIIVKAVEEETGRELSLELCMAIVQIVAEAQSA